MLQETLIHDYTNIGDINKLITKVEEYMLNNGMDSIIVKLNKNIDPISYIEVGFLPVNNWNEQRIFKLPEDNFIELYFINKFSDNETRFWGTNNISIAENIRQLKTHSEWMYCNIKGWIQFSISHGNSLPLHYYIPRIRFTNQIDLKQTCPCFAKQHH